MIRPNPISYESPGIQLDILGTYRTGVFGNNTAASIAHDPGTQRLFVANEGQNKLDVLDIRDPSQPSLLFSADLSPFGSLPTHVAVNNGRVAVIAENAFDPGKVVFFDAGFTAGDEPLNVVTVGVSPDMVPFAPDGLKALVASEGRPNSEYTIDPLGSISIIDLSQGMEKATVNTLNFSEFNEQKEALIEAGVRIYGPNLTTPDPNDTASVAQDLEPEFIIVSPDSHTAWVNLQENNALAVVNIDEGVVTDIRPLGAKDHSQPGNGLDASDEDGGINITPWPVNGLYQPDGLASYQAFGETFLVTANEGNSRDDEGFSEVQRVKDVTLDPAAFPDAVDLQKEENLGRLKITSVEGDTDGDGDFDELFSFGGRSFSIWSEDGKLVFDSGDDIEQITAAAVPSNFNSQSNKNTFDDRSDDNGPEPHTVVTGNISGHTYAFVALESIGGIVAYDVTNPYAPQGSRMKDYGPLCGPARKKPRPEKPRFCRRCSIGRSRFPPGIGNEWVSCVNPGLPAHLKIDKLPDGRYRATVGTVLNTRSSAGRATLRGCFAAFMSCSHVGPLRRWLPLSGPYER